MQALKMGQERDYPELAAGECDGSCRACGLEGITLKDRPEVAAAVDELLSPEFLDTMPELRAEIEAMDASGSPWKGSKKRRA